MRALRVPAVLREEPRFRVLFAGQALSVVGDRMTAVVLPFAVLSIGGTATDVGIVAGAQLAPFVLFALVAGVVADRIDRRRILAAMSVIGVAAGLLCLAHPSVRSLRRGDAPDAGQPAPAL